MIAHLNGEFETVDYSASKSILLYDNGEKEEYPLHWHNAAEIIMPVENGYEVFCAGKKYIMNPRDILIIPARALHSLNAMQGRRFILLCDNKIIAGNPILINLNYILDEPLLINSDCTKELRDSSRRIIEDISVLYSNLNDINEVYIYIKLLTLLTRIAEYRQSRINFTENGRHANIFRRVTKYIDQNYMNDIMLEDLAELAGYCTYYFSRMFKKYSGTSFVDYLNRRRINAAQLLLSETDASITDIAMQTGFSSITTFNRVFKNINGCTPSEYKKLYSENSLPLDIYRLIK